MNAHALNADTSNLALSPQNPWPGLRAFGETDREFFFGRERETAELLSIVKRASVVVLYGQSGLGKTSLLQAGLFPELKRLNFLPLRLRFDHSEDAAPLAQQLKAALSAELDRAGVEAPRPSEQESLWEYFHRRDLDFWGGSNRLLTPVIVLDQFEEVFTLGQKNERTASRVAQFASELESVIEHRPPDAVRERLEQRPDDALHYDFQRQSANFVLSLREDFLPQLDPWRMQMPSLLAHRFRLERMTGAQALTVVERAGRDIVEAKVAQDIVDFVSASQLSRQARSMEQREVAPALLSVVCDELNRRRTERGQDRITADLLTLERDAIIQDFYARAFEGADPRVRVWVEDELLTSTGHRDRGAVEDAIKQGLPEASFDLLVDRRVLHREEREGVIWLELTHDLLTDPAARSRSEREQRLEKEAAAKREAEFAAKLRRTRRWALVFAVLLLFSAGALVATIVAESQAKLSEANAKQSESKAKESEGKAKEAEAKAKEAEGKAKAEQARAEANEARAMESEKRWQEETLRFRVANFKNIDAMIDFADQLIDKLPRGQTADMRAQKASMLLEQGRNEEALKEATTAIDEAPLLSSPHTNRGYQYILAGKPAKALEDFEFIRNKIDPKDALNDLNISVAKAMMGEYAAARAAIQHAIVNGRDVSFGDTEISPDIRRTTGKIQLVADADAMLVLLQYQLANIAAYMGDTQFEDDLRRADQISKSHRPETKQDAYLVALNWAWLQQTKKAKSSPPDYGALVAQGALWQRAGFPDWTACYYHEFAQIHRKRNDARYAGLARWVEQQRKSSKNLSPDCASMRRDKPSVRQLEQEAREFAARKKYAEAVRRLNEALHLDPQDPRNESLMIERASNYFMMGRDADNRRQKAQDELDDRERTLKDCEKSPESLQSSGDAPKCRDDQIEKLKREFTTDKEEAETLYNKVLGDCNVILHVNPRMEDAYLWRAIAQFYLSDAKFTDAVVSDLREVLRLNPNSGGALYWLSKKAKKDDSSAKEGLAMVERFNQLYPGNADMLARQAGFQIRLNMYPEALRSVQKAISLSEADFQYIADGVDLYRLRARARTGLGISTEQVQRELAGSYFRMADTLHKHGGDASSDGSNKAWKELGKLTGLQEDVRCDPTVTICQQRKLVNVTSQFVVATINSIQPGGTPESRFVEADRGIKDGITIGTAVDVYSLYEWNSQHNVEKIGHGEVISAGPDTAIMQITLPSKPYRIVREGDLLWFRARMPNVAPGSPLWEVARHHIDLVSSDGHHLVNYRDLYIDETPEQVSRMFRDLEEEIRSAAPKVAAGKPPKSEPIASGRFAGKSTQQVFTSVNREDIKAFLQWIIAEERGPLAGKSWPLGELYLVWVENSAPE